MRGKVLKLKSEVESGELRIREVMEFGIIVFLPGSGRNCDGFKEDKNEEKH